MYVLRHEKKGIPPVFIEDGVLWLPADGIDILKAGWDGERSREFEGRGYVPATWYVKEYPKTAHVILQMQAKWMEEASREP